MAQRPLFCRLCVRVVESKVGACLDCYAEWVKLEDLYQEILRIRPDFRPFSISKIFRALWEQTDSAKKARAIRS